MISLALQAQRLPQRATTNSLSSRPEPECQRRRSGGTCGLLNAERSGDERFCETSENVPSVPMSREGHAFYSAVSHANRIKELSPQPRLRLSVEERRFSAACSNESRIGASAPDRHRVPRPSRAFCGYSLPLAKSKGDDRKSRLIPSSVVPMLRTSRSMGQPGRDGSKVGQPPVTGDDEGAVGVQRHRVRATTNGLSSRPEPERQRRRSGGTCCLMNAERSRDERFCEASENVPSVPMSPRTRKHGAPVAWIMSTETKCEGWTTRLTVCRNTSYCAP